jgi:CMP-N-acetylneuraminic acid synthetase
MEIVGLMLVKKESKRLPNKNTLDYFGKPMFLWNLEKCLSIFDDVFVSSDSEEILKIAEENGAIPIKRGKKLCGDTPNIPVYRHAQKIMSADAFVAVQANSPEVPETLIRFTKDILQEGTFLEVMTCHKDFKLYGSIWGMTSDRLAKYGDPFKPTPEVLLLDPSVDIHTKKDYAKSINNHTQF